MEWARISQDRRSRLLSWAIGLSAVFYGAFVCRALWSEFVPGLASPRIDCQPAVYNFGVRSVGDRFQGSVVIRNRGEAPLILSGVTTQCGCVHVVIGRTVIPPKHYVNLPIVIALDQEQEKMSQSLTIHSNDPERPEHVLAVKGRVVAQGTL